LFTEFEETFVEVSLAVIFIIIACIGGFFLYRTYRRRKAQGDVVFLVNDPIDTQHDNEVVEM